MAAPNLVRKSKIVGKIGGKAVTNSASAVLTNPINSGQVYKVISLYIANIHGANNGTITIDFYRGSTALELAKSTAVANATSIVAIKQEAPIYLEEGDSLRVTADANATLTAVASYEIIQ